MSVTSIEWTDVTWNPVRGCSRVSEGCRHCYAERMAARNLPGSRSPTTGEAFAILNGDGPHWTGKVELIESQLVKPLHWKKPRRVFVNSMSDLFHEALSIDDIVQVFSVMYAAKQHDFQVLTKRAGQLRELIPRITQIFDILPNVWLGVSVEDQSNKYRIDLLRQTPAAVRFLSIEPLLEDIGELDLTGIHWVIVGGESGPGARPCYVSWITSILAKCKAAGVPVFVKQLGSNPVWSLRTLPKSDELLKDSKGGNWEEWPADLRVREFPR